MRARRREARRRRRLGRIDLGLGLIAAFVLLLATPGLAISAVMAFVVLALCILSFVLEQRNRRRTEQLVHLKRARPRREENGDRARRNLRQPL